MSTLMRLTAIWTPVAGKPLSVGLDFESNLALTLANLQDATNRAVLEWNSATTLKSYFANAIVLNRCEAYAYDLVANGSPPPNYKRVISIGPVLTTSGVAATDTGTGVPPNVAYVATHRTAIASRRTRGRVYLPPISTTHINANGSVDNTWRATIRTAWQNWCTAIENSATVPQTLVHSVVSLTGGFVNGITTYEVHDRVDTQRRRLQRSIDIN